MSTQTQVLDPSQDKTIPTPVRIQSVFYYMDKEPLIKERFTTLVSVKKRSGEIVKFPVEVLEVAKHLHASGKDALDIGKADILIAARQVLNLSHTQPTQKTQLSSEKGTRMVRQTIHGMLKLAASLVGKLPKSAERDGLEEDISGLASSLGLNGAVDYTPVIPYSLVLSASQMSKIDPDMAKRSSEFDAVIKKLQKFTSES